ncbi:uncharacterized protein EAE98_002615 [Botrytis deweyae]|uniref:DUF7708 domain-containing protein n=1 Tax=Botrytis deweyae TaxID=2478750 RepID=A0ABQ7IXN6_9HELO|nr:uncharacterized protein EAE98_002615 [Botrytis deweyae]KAF7936396.1 hypothetical protein EAE98_002615 [Botrytis deweyae]
MAHTSPQTGKRLREAVRVSVLRSKRYFKIEKEAVNISSKDRFDSVWNQVNHEKTRFDENYEKGCGLISKKCQDTSVAMQDFMKKFAPILEIIKTFASPYGTVAFGTISILFVSKHELEQQVGSTISAIKDRLPGLQVYQHIYTDKKELDVKLQGQIVMAYQEFIEYCILATRYYKKLPISE